MSDTARIRIPSSSFFFLPVFPEDTRVIVPGWFSASHPGLQPDILWCISCLTDVTQWESKLSQRHACWDAGRAVPEDVSFIRPNLVSPLNHLHEMAAEGKLSQITLLYNVRPGVGTGAQNFTEGFLSRRREAIWLKNQRNLKETAWTSVIVEEPPDYIPELFSDSLSV